MRVLLSLLLVFGFYTAAWADEKITDFDVAINIKTNGDIDVVETIRVIAEGRAIRRGIFRELPRYYLLDGDKIPYRYKFHAVTRNGEKEEFKIQTDGNAKRNRIGEADVFLQDGPHTYTISYSVKNQVDYFETYDEIYWNVTGSYWAFPIEKARAAITLPDGGVVQNHAAYTGKRGESKQDYRFREINKAYIFETTKPLARREGFTVSLSFDKGLIDPPSAADKRWLWWARNAPLAILLLTFLGVLGYYYARWKDVGRDPVKPPVFPRYEPPKGYSPAGLSHIYYKGLRGNRALVSTLMGLAIKGRLEIDASSKKQTKFTAQVNETGLPRLHNEEAKLLRLLFPVKPATMILKKKYHSKFYKAHTKWKTYVRNHFSEKFHRWNIGPMIAGVFFTGFGIVFALSQLNTWKPHYGLLLLGLAVLNILFFILMPAPTKLGQAVKSEIDGFRLYMKTAEALQLNAAKVGSDAPPPMTKDRYEQFLPYAVALGVEKPWSKYFEAVLPQEAENYNPGWAHLSRNKTGSATSFSDNLSSSLSSGVSSAAPASSSSSGSGGGGFSGGGGGGGGGGGW